MILAGQIMLGVGLYLVAVVAFEVQAGSSQFWVLIIATSLIAAGVRAMVEHIGDRVSSGRRES